MKVYKRETNQHQKQEEKKDNRDTTTKKTTTTGHTTNPTKRHQHFKGQSTLGDARRDKDAHQSDAGPLQQDTEQLKERNPTGKTHALRPTQAVRVRIVVHLFWVSGFFWFA